MDVGPVHLEHLLRLAGKIGQLRNAGLHAVGHLVLGDPRGDFRIAEFAQVELVQLGDVVEHAAAHVAAHAVGVREVQHRVAAAAEFYALELRRQEAAAPVEVVKNLPARGFLVARGHDDERRQVLGVAAQAVGQPGAHARAAGLLGAGEKEGNRRGVVDGLGVQRFDEAAFVGDRRDVRQEIADPGPALAVLLRTS